MSMSALWKDEGPVSQGKILTALLQDREADAMFMLRRWSPADLLYLRNMAERLVALADREAARRG